MKRKLFLETFLRALGAVLISWGKVEQDKIYGTVVYDLTDPEDRQDFVWHRTEENVPSGDVRKLIQYLSDNHFIDSDRITIPLYEYHFDFIEPSKQKQVIDELFHIEVKMVDEGEETDTYFLHL
jgi:hypothetical protein